MSQLLGGGSSGFIKSIQRRTIAITGAVSNTATITAVDVANSSLRYLGATNSSNSNDCSAYPMVTLTNSTTITASVNTSPGAAVVTVSVEITEYYPGVLKSVQRGIVALGGVTPVTGTLTTTVDPTKAEISFLGFISSDVGTQSAVLGSIALTNGTTVTASSIGTGALQSVAYEVREYY